MSGLDEFLATIIDARGDDAPRLVYADYLEERGDPRGEFIRVQCELARLPSDDVRRPDLEGRQLQLLGAHRKQWTGKLRPGQMVTGASQAVIGWATTVFAGLPARADCRTWRRSTCVAMV